MFKFTLISFILLFAGLFFSIIAFVAYRKIKQGVKYTIDKGASISSEYHKKFIENAQLSKFPEIVQKGIKHQSEIESSINKLPQHWQIRLKPLAIKSDRLLNEISHHLIHNESFERTKLPALRSFFNHNLDAFKQLCQKLESDHESLTDDQIEKAKANITLIESNLRGHESLLEQKRSFDFDVLMDVIKARIK